MILQLISVNAIYESTHPEYALYLYLMAPISLAILNPIAFVMMEISKLREVQASDRIRGKTEICKLRVARQILKGVAYNPVLVMTVLGIIGNIVFKHQLPVYIEALLEVCDHFICSLARNICQLFAFRNNKILLTYNTI